MSYRPGGGGGGGGWAGSGRGGRGGQRPHLEQDDSRRSSSDTSFHQRGGAQRGYYRGRGGSSQESFSRDANRPPSGAQQYSSTAAPPRPRPAISLPKVMTAKISSDLPLEVARKPDPNIEKKRAQMLERKISAMSLQDSSRPVRPDKGGQLGRPLRLRANHFRVDLPIGEGHHYDIELRTASRANKMAPTPKCLLRTAVYYWLRRIGVDPYNFAFDGKRNLYGNRRIDIVLDGQLNTFRFQIPPELMPPTEARTDGAPSSFELQVSYAAEVNFDLLNAVLDSSREGTHIELQQIMNVTNIVLKQFNTDRDYPVVRNTVFPPNLQPEQPMNLSGTLELWNGYYQAVRPTALKTINVDVSYSAFLAPKSLIQILCDSLPFVRNQLESFTTRPATPQQFAMMNEALQSRLKQKRIEVTIELQTRKYTFDRLMRDGAHTQRFDLNVNGVNTAITVEDYFKSRKQCEIHYKYLPVVKAAGRNTYLPLELCMVMPNQHAGGKLTPDEQGIMVRNSSTKPVERMNNINSYVQDAADFKNSPYMNRFGVKVHPNMAEVSGRVVPGPAIHFGPWLKDQRKGANVEQIHCESMWNVERGRQFLSPGVINRWAVVRLKAPNERPDHVYDEIATNLCEMLPRQAQALGMQMPKNYDWHDLQCEELSDYFKHLVKKPPKPDLVLVLLPSDGTDVYANVKRIAELQMYENGITTQCLGTKTMHAKRGLSTQHVINILMKINHKLNDGENWRLPSIFDIMKIDGKPTPYAVMGADVNHPRPGADKRYPSLAAVTCSIDPYSMRYSAVFNVQRHHKETIENLDVMVHALLQNFYQKNSGRKPQRIVFFRDGVSEGEFQKCVKEIKKIRMACTKLDQQYSPHITYVCVLKRHHTRLFAVDQKELNRSGNVPAGTTVDQGVTHAREFDFFLVSHSGGVGTSRPTHYHVIHDENNFSSDRLEQLTYYLCYCCARCTKSISYPAPCYYAHLMADRASHYIKEAASTQIDAAPCESQRSGGSGSEISKTKREIRDEAKQFANREVFQSMRIHEDLRLQMFFT